MSPTPTHVPNDYCRAKWLCKKSPKLDLRPSSKFGGKATRSLTVQNTKWSFEKPRVRGNQLLNEMTCLLKHIDIEGTSAGYIDILKARQLVYIDIEGTSLVILIF